MRFNKEKKKAIQLYILEKISQGTPAIARHVSDSLEIDQSTIFRYLKELEKEEVIEKSKRGQYRLKSDKWIYELSRNHGDLNSDLYAYDAFMKPHIEHLSANIKSIWQYSLSEMVNNIMDHSEAEHARLTIIQNFLRTTVILQDDGIGIFNKICSYFHFSSADEAITELFKGKLTTDQKNHSGEGIFFSSRMLDEFFILSSERIFSCNPYNEEQILLLADKNLKGTCVIMALANNSTKQPKDIIDQYADVEGGFTRTLLPLKCLFDSPPVSRSQAKRLCYRLEKFEEVTLDFQGINWMGQGFAHQLFVVFQNEHPDIVLKPVNLDENAEKMLQHVLAENNQDR